MRKQFISLADTGRFSQLICDYLSEKKSLKEFYGVYPSLENAQIQINLKKDTYSKRTREILVKTINDQYRKIIPTKEVEKNLKLLAKIHRARKVWSGMDIIVRYHALSQA